MDKVDYEAKLASEVEKLRAFQESLESEYKATHAANSDGEPELVASEVIARTNHKLLKAVDSAADCIIHLLDHADKDATRFAVAKFVIDRAGAHPEAAGDPMELLLKKLTAANADQ